MWRRVRAILGACGPIALASPRQSLPPLHPRSTACEPNVVRCEKTDSDAVRASLMTSQDQCGEMLTESGMGGMSQMGIFYDHCLEALYPPGSCGTFCSESFCASALVRVCALLFNQARVRQICTRTSVSWRRFGSRAAMRRDRTALPSRIFQTHAPSDARLSSQSSWRPAVSTSGNRTT